jgi:hypothetical protein
MRLAGAIAAGGTFEPASIGAVKTRQDSSTDAFDLEQTLDVWPHLRFGRP